MHEVSLVRSIFSALKDAFSPEELDRITSIELQVGALSNAEPILLQSAFEAYKAAEQQFETVSLNIETVPIEIVCDSCGVHSSVENFRFVCHSCGKPSRNIVRGLELMIHRVHFESS